MRRPISIVVITVLISAFTGILKAKQKSTWVNNPNKNIAISF
jgi:hypothetical protein